MQSDFVFHVLAEEDKEFEGWSAICLDLNICVDGKTKRAAFDNLHKAVSHYVHNVLHDRDYKALFRPAPKEEWDKFFSKKLRPVIKLESLPLSA